MANPRATDGERRAGGRRRSYSELEGREKVTPEPEVSEVRRIRIERLEGDTSTRRPVATLKMTSESHATLPSLKSGSTHRRKKDRHHHSGNEETKHRRRRKSTSKEESTYVYGAPKNKSHSSRAHISETRRLGRDGESSDSDKDSIQSEPAGLKPRRRKIKIVYVDEEDFKVQKPKERRSKTEREVRDRARDGGESIRRSRASVSRRHSTVERPPASSHRRSESTRDLPSEARPTIKRSNTTTSHIPTTKSPHVPSLNSTNTSNKRSSFLGSFFGPSLQPHHEPEKLVECLTCLSDDIPRSKSAKLKCGHRMCHSCLRRIFKLSVTDPQHMPPKCCTADHIPLKHVERLFDINFKKNWNRKYQEYTTKNRIYCPARRCGEWIKPGNIHREDGRKYGKCGRCKTKVCCLCNGKWHGTQDCPKDEETNRLLETAKQAGWQRCYNCRTMVELKEGCNHMTCRCTAEFCMICGLKWKSCNCPWFNYEAVEADRLNHMQVPEDAEAEQRPHRPRRQQLYRFLVEPNQRQRQMREDEEFARRVQRLAMIDGEEDDHQGGIGDIHGVGNGAGHFMNQDYIQAAHNILTGTYDQATVAANYVMGLAQARGGPPPPPGLGQRRMGDRYPIPNLDGRQGPPPPPPPPALRRHTMREQAYNAQIPRPSERVVPRRTRTDYASEAAVHAPIGRESPRSASNQGTPRPSVQAGLGGSGRGSNRVNAWRTHVEPGLEPTEVLSM